MSTWRKRGCWAGRLAMLVIGLAMLAPTVSRMLVHHGGVPRAGWIEVCSSSGIHRLPQGSAAVERDGQDARAMRPEPVHRPAFQAQRPSLVIPIHPDFVPAGLRQRRLQARQRGLRSGGIHQHGIGPDGMGRTIAFGRLRHQIHQGQAGHV